MKLEIGQRYTSGPGCPRKITAIQGNNVFWRHDVGDPRDREQCSTIKQFEHWVEGIPHLYQPYMG
jgi:hypothetical protein